MMECWQKRTVLEKKSLVTLIVLLIALTALITLIVLVSEPQYCHTSSCINSSQHISSLIDSHADPCHNFYNFACGNALNRSKQSQFRSIVNDAKTTSRKILKDIVSEPINVNDTKSLKLQKQFYRSCSDLEAIDVDNDATFWALITKLGGWPVVSGNNWDESAFDFAEFMVGLREAGLQHDWFLDISVYSNLGKNIILEINVPDNANKIEGEMEEEYVDLMVKTAMAFGAHGDIAKSQMPEVMYFENKLANLIDEIHDENELLYRTKPLQLLTIDEVQTKWQKINWLELLNQLTKKKLDNNQQVAFYVKNYMPKLDKLLKETTKRTQVNYVIWKLVETYSPFLSKRIRDLVLNYSISTNQSDLWYKDRENFCFEEARSFFQYSLEAAYLRRYIPEKKRQNIEEIIERIMDEMEQHLRDALWMDEKIRRVAINMLQNVSYIIGGPQEMYYADQFDKNFGAGNMEFHSSNIIEISTEIFLRGLDTLYKKNYEDTNYLKYTFYELVPSQETKFFENFNLLWIPAGALHEFFYANDRPNYVNYGTMGAIISHNLVRGLYNGIFRNSSLWSNETFKNFEEAIDCLYNCTDGLNFNMDCAANVLGNMADYIGINLAYEAYKKWLKQNGPERRLPGLDFTNNQMFWLVYGSLMCHLPVPELNYNRSDNMMQSLRVVGPFRNSLYFSKDFKCELGSNMSPRNKCQIL